MVLQSPHYKKVEEPRTNFFPVQMPFFSGWGKEESEQERKKTRPYYSGICLTLGTHGAWPHAERLIDGFYCNLWKFGMDSILHMQDGSVLYIKLVSYMWKWFWSCKIYLLLIKDFLIFIYVWLINLE
jgi:hypothetical protein